MKNLKIKTILLLMLVFSIVSCAQNKKSDANESTEAVELISVVDLQSIDNGVQLIDVRTPEEYASGHIKDAKNINFFDANFLEQMESLNKDIPLYIYCKSGRRSGIASKKLEEIGFTKVYDLNGGILNWNKNNLKVNK